jgi:integrase/recombinase XerD
VGHSPEGESVKKEIQSFISCEALRGIRDLSTIAPRLKPFFTWLDMKEMNVEEVGVKDAIEFQSCLTTLTDEDGRLHYGTCTVRTILGVVRRFYAWLESTGKVYANPFLKTGKVRLERKLPRGIPDEAATEKLLSALHDFWKQKTLRNQRLYYRCHVMAELLYSTGLRISEALALTPEDLDFENRTARVREGKGGSSRTAYLNEYVSRVLKLYLDEMRETVLVNDTETLFGVKDRSTISLTFHRVLTEEGSGLISGKVTSHLFRHALGYHLLKRGCDIRYIQLVLGHRDLNSTAIYTKVNREELKNELDEYHPRSLLRKKHEEP